MTMGPIGTFVSLFILNQLNGTSIEVGIAVAVFNGIGIPAAILWGKVTDVFQKRKPIIVASFASTAITVALFFFVHSIYQTYLLYGVFSIVSSANAVPLNLLVMETQPKSHWATAFSQFSLFAGTGVTFGLLISFFWTDFFPLYALALPLAILSFASAILAVMLIKEPSFVFENEIIALQKPSLFQRLTQLPVIFLKIPHPSDFRAVFKGLRYELTRQLPLLLISIFFFNFAGGVLNTSLTPSLKSARVSDTGIFFVPLIQMAVQTLSFRYAGPYIEKRTLKKTAVSGLTLRTACYALFAPAVFFLTGAAYLATSVILYMLAAGIGYAVYSTASNTMVFDSLGKRRQGSMLGVYSALIGLGTMLGSLISGYISSYWGYYITFIVAMLFLVLTTVLTSLLPDTKSQG